MFIKYVCPFMICLAELFP